MLSLPGRPSRRQSQLNSIRQTPRKKNSMDNMRRILASLAVITAAVLGGCSNGAGTREHQPSGEYSASRGEHDRDGGEHAGEGRGEEGEESGTELSLNERYDEIRNGARLILAYNTQSNSFSGTVENTTDRPMKRVRVEVHLSNGNELGPTTPADLGPGEQRDVKLTATSKDVDKWTAHPEVGSGEHSRGEEHGDHD
jgi:hypothetical protein